jgi:hypothetical protein
LDTSALRELPEYSPLFMAEMAMSKSCYDLVGKHYEDIELRAADMISRKPTVNTKIPIRLTRGAIFEPHLSVELASDVDVPMTIITRERGINNFDSLKQISILTKSNVTVPVATVVSKLRSLCGRMYMGNSTTKCRIINLPMMVKTKRSEFIVPTYHKVFDIQFKLPNGFSHLIMIDGIMDNLKIDGVVVHNLSSHKDWIVKAVTYVSNVVQRKEFRTGVTSLGSLDDTDIFKIFIPFANVVGRLEQIGNMMALRLKRDDIIVPIDLIRPNVNLFKPIFTSDHDFEPLKVEGFISLPETVSHLVKDDAEAVDVTIMRMHGVQRYYENLMNAKSRYELHQKDLLFMNYIKSMGMSSRPQYISNFDFVYAPEDQLELILTEDDTIYDVPSNSIMAGTSYHFEMLVSMVEDFKIRRGNYTNPKANDIIKTILGVNFVTRVSIALYWYYLRGTDLMRDDILYLELNDPMVIDFPDIEPSRKPVDTEFIHNKDEALQEILASDTFGLLIQEIFSDDEDVVVEKVKELLSSDDEEEEKESFQLDYSLLYGSYSTGGVTISDLILQNRSQGAITNIVAFARDLPISIHVESVEDLKRLKIALSNVSDADKIKYNQMVIVLYDDGYLSKDNLSELLIS